MRICRQYCLRHVLGQEITDPHRPCGRAQTGEADSLDREAVASGD
jgi:hypothetical protein